MVEAFLTPQCGRSFLTPPFQILDFIDKELVRLDQPTHLAENTRLPTHPTDHTRLPTHSTHHISDYLPFQ